ncbi:MAG: ribonuclease J [Bacilli bacterium]|nr:ribonuclease J [Bacilli bacterium]
MSKIKIFGLGGLNENGKNMYVVEVNNDLFVLDAGLKYADDKMLGIDYVLPSFDYLKENADKIKGIFVTHGHDSQTGAIGDIIKEIPNIKIYGTEFTIEMIKEELIEDKIDISNLVIIKPHQKIVFGDVSVFPIALTHSVPGNVGYVINTEDGAIVYTGNFLFDQTMLGAYKADIGKLAYVGKQGVLCLLSESLYADKIGYTSPNNRITSIMSEVLEKNEGRILVNIFQAQIYRIQELFKQIALRNRKVVIMGKKLESIIFKAIDMGYFEFDKSNILTIHHVNDENIVVLISDEREKPFSNITRIIRGYDKFIKLSSEDTVVFASPIYDGMEKSATKVFDEISKKESNLIILSSKKYLAHHASSEDLMMMINLMNPKYYFPVIGEYRHQVANAKLAEKMEINKQNILLRLNGEVVTFEKGILVKSEGNVKVDDILVDGKTSGDIGELVLKDRELLSDNGIVIVSVTLDKATKKVLAGPEILTRGFIYVKDNLELIKEAAEISLEVIEANTHPNYIDFNKVKLGIRNNLGKYLYKETECKPMILIVMQEV